MSSENKFIIGIGVVTLIVIIAGALFFGKQKPAQNSQDARASVDQAQLISGAAHTIGNENAPVQIVEFADQQCPACRAAHPIVQQVLKTYGQDIYYVWRHYPLAVHKNSKIAAQADEAAAIQGKFFEMSDKLFTNQTEWENSNNPNEFFEKYAKEIGLDVEKFKADINTTKDIIDKDYALGNSINLESTPTFFINGTRYPGVIQFSQFEQIISGITGSQTPASTSAQPSQ